VPSAKKNPVTPRVILEEMVARRRGSKVTAGVQESLAATGLGFYGGRDIDRVFFFSGGGGPLNAESLSNHHNAPARRDVEWPHRGAA